VANPLCLHPFSVTVPEDNQVMTVMFRLPVLLRLTLNSPLDRQAAQITHSGRILLADAAQR